MTIEFLGTAGYHPSATRHTACALVSDLGSDDAILLDAGTGLFRLIGKELPRRLHICLSHAHLDHVVGLTFLLDVTWNRDLEVCVYGDAPTLEVVQKLLFGSALFPLEWSYETHVVDGDFEIAGARVSTQELTHPGGSRAFRFDWPAFSLAYVTDTLGDDRYFPLIQNVDVLIHECNFPVSRQDLAQKSGHCTSADFERAVRASNARLAIATHFNPYFDCTPLELDSVTTNECILAARDQQRIELEPK